MVCPNSNVSDFIVKQLWVGAHSDWLGSVKEEVSSRTSGRSIVSDHPESKDRLFRETRFRLPVSRNASLVGTKDGHQVLCKIQQVRSGNFTYDEDGLWWWSFLGTSSLPSLWPASWPIQRCQRFPSCPTVLIWLSQISFCFRVRKLLWKDIILGQLA